MQGLGCRVSGVGFRERGLGSPNFPGDFKGGRWF